MHSAFLPAAAILILAVSGPTLADKPPPTCTPIDSGYFVFYRSTMLSEDPCEEPAFPPIGEGFVVWLFALTQAPDPVRLNCSYEGGGFLCEAWPQAIEMGELTYGWSTDGGAWLPWPGDPASPFRTVGCGQFPGSVTVSVTSPGGYANTATRAIFACP